MTVKIKKFKYEILLVLAIISLLSSLILSFIPVQEFCDIEKISSLASTGNINELESQYEEGCGVVHSSSYNYTFGIKNSYYGVFIFLFLSLLIYYQIKKPTNIKINIIHLAIIFGTIVATVFLCIQQFVLNAYCEYCVVIDVCMLLSLLVIIFNWKK